jgi:ketosteroid isomerase-like protein
MNGHRSELILALSVWFFSGCQREAVDTRAQDERAIREADAATLKAAQAKDVDGAVANYADDAWWLPPNAPLVNGKPGIRAGWSKLIGSPGFNIDWQINKLEIARADDLAYTIYSYQLTLEGLNGKPSNDHGKDMAVWKKQSDGTWKMVADTFNSDLPSLAPAPAKNPEHRRGATKHHPSKKHHKTR